MLTKEHVAELFAACMRALNRPSQAVSHEVMPKSKSKGKRKAVILQVAKTIRPSKDDSEELAKNLLDLAADLPWLELYPEGKNSCM